jgi:hypothetical protein
VQALQVVYGIRYFISYNVGLQAELGIGQPYLAEAGIAFKFNSIKPASMPMAPSTETNFK